MAASPNKAAIDLGARAGVDDAMVHISYPELLSPGQRVRGAAPDFRGLKAGDRVTLHMPMVPELPVTMLACARLGVVHPQVFGGFAARRAGRGSRTPAAGS